MKDDKKTNLKLKLLGLKFIQEYKKEIYCKK
jgi:hypothetical protein